MAVLEEVVAQRIESAVPGVKFSLVSTAPGLLLRLHEERSIVPRLPYICAAVDALLPLHAVQVGEDPPILASAILKTWPQRPLLSGECAAGLDRQVLLGKLLEVAIAEICRSRSIFVVSLEGEYLRAQLSSVADPPCAPEAMEGRRIADVCGQEAHDEICRQAKAAHLTGEPQGAYYQAHINGEQRVYTARITPIKATNLVWLVVRRIDGSHDR